MPSDLENAKLMFLCLQFSTATAFDYKKIGDECGVSAGAASKRMSRLKQAVKEGKEAGLDVRYLWSCIQNSDMNNVDFKAVGKELGLNSGAASKRWSRLKQALERGETGSTASASDASSNKKRTASSKKRQNTETADDEEFGIASVKKKAKSNPSTTRKINIAKKDSNDDGEDDTIDGESDFERKAIMTDKKSAPSHAKAATAATPKVNSAPPALRRRRRPLTDEEIYQKLNVDEAEELEKRNLGPHLTAYPKHHNLTETFQAVRTPDGKKTAASAIFDDIDIPGEKNDNVRGGDDGYGDDDEGTMLVGDGSWYPTPMDSSNKRTTTTTTTVQDVFSAIAEEAMKSPSAAEQRLLSQKKAKEESEGGGAGAGNGWFQVPQNLPNPFVVGDAPLAGPRPSYESFFTGDDDEIGDAEEYC